MRTKLELVLLGWILASSQPLWGAQEFPYKAYLNREEVYIRCGPGEDYYPTDKLKIGQEVEVYRHDPGGWYAIRPPEGSFTWVSGRYLDLKQDHLATINGERVAARVGSRFSDIRDVIQVRLQKGENVEILDSITSSDGHGGKTTWYKIAPPSGEFRWVFGKYVDPEYPHDGLRRPHAHPVSMEAAAEMRAGPQPVASRLAERPVPALPPPPSMRAVHNDPPQMELRRSPEEPPAIAQPMRHTSPEEFQTELDDLDLKLSLMVAEEVTVWTFDELGPRAQAMLDQAQTAVEHGKARLLLNKVARFEEIKRRSDAVNNLSQQTQRRSGELAQLIRQRAEAAPAELSDRFDGVGRLTRVVSPAAGAPRYALVEPDGQVRCYVSPAPGVNLQHYVGRDVGINGMRGYIPEQQAHHVMAKHVTLLDDTQMR